METPSKTDGSHTEKTHTPPPPGSRCIEACRRHGHGIGLLPTNPVQPGTYQREGRKRLERRVLRVPQIPHQYELASRHRQSRPVIADLTFSPSLHPVQHGGVQHGGEPGIYGSTCPLSTSTDRLFWDPTNECLTPWRRFPKEFLTCSTQFTTADVSWGGLDRHLSHMNLRPARDRRRITQPLATL